MAKLLSLQERILLGLSILGDTFEDVATVGGLAGFAYKTVYGFVPRRYQKSYFVQTLSRKLKTGEMKKVIRNGKVYLSLTRRGQKKVERLFPYQRLQNEASPPMEGRSFLGRFGFVLASFIPALGRAGYSEAQNKKWSGEWLIVVFDIPEKQKRNRDVLRNKLYELGFGKLQRSVFISPFDVYEDLVELLESWGLSRQALLIETKKLWIEDEKEMVDRIWKVSKINKAYENLIEQAEEEKVDIKKWIDNYFEVLLSDPFLPHQLLPDNWGGDEARRVFKRLIKKID